MCRGDAFILHAHAIIPSVIDIDVSQRISEVDMCSTVQGVRKGVKPPRGHYSADSLSGIIVHENMGASVTHLLLGPRWWGQLWWKQQLGEESESSQHQPCN